MHLVIINGSPRVKKYSNTDKIITSFAKGFCENGNTYELYTISDRSEWEKEPGTKMYFILQGGFAEGCQLRCSEAFLEKLPGFLGCEYGGTLVKGDNFIIRITEGDDRARILAPYEEMGRLFSEKASFDNEEAKAFTGPEVFPKHVQILLQIMFKTFTRGTFKKAAKSWGCTRPLIDRPYEQ